MNPETFDFRMTLSGVTRIVTAPAAVANLVPVAKLVLGGAELTAAQTQAVLGGATNVSSAATCSSTSRSSRLRRG